MLFNRSDFYFWQAEEPLFSMEISFASGAEPKWVVVGQNVRPLLELSSTGL